MPHLIYVRYEMQEKDYLAIALLELVRLSGKTTQPGLVHAVLDGVDLLTSRCTAALVARADVFAQEGRHAEAVATLRALVQERPKNLLAKNALAMKLISLDMVGGRELLREVASAVPAEGEHKKIEQQMIEIARRALFDVLEEPSPEILANTNIRDFARA
jgi:Flp pilus assembly protein TadD